MTTFYLWRHCSLWFCDVIGVKSHGPLKNTFDLGCPDWYLLKQPCKNKNKSAGFWNGKREPLDRTREAAWAPGIGDNWYSTRSWTKVWTNFGRLPDLRRGKATSMCELSISVWIKFRSELYLPGVNLVNRKHAEWSWWTTLVGYYHCWSTANSAKRKKRGWKEEGQFGRASSVVTTSRGGP